MGTSANLVFIQVYGKSFKGVGLTSAHLLFWHFLERQDKHKNWREDGTRRTGR